MSRSLKLICAVVLMAVASPMAAQAAANKKFAIYFDVTNIFLRSSYFVGGLDIGLGKLSIGPTGGLISGGFAVGGSLKYNFKGLGENGFYIEGLYDYRKTTVTTPAQVAGLMA